MTTQDRIVALLERMDARIAALEAAPSKVSESVAPIKADKFPGFTALRAAHAGGYCRKHRKGFAFASGYAHHKAWCKAR